jgi:hypothetical protein
LGTAYVVLLCDAVQCLIVCLLVANEWTVCFDDDVVLVAVFDGSLLLTPGVELECVSRANVGQERLTYLDLVDGRWPDLAD